MEPEIITLTDEDGQPVRFELLDVIGWQKADYAVLLPADEEAEQFLILRAEPDPDDPEDYLFAGIDDQAAIDGVFHLFRKRHPEFFEG